MSRKETSEADLSRFLAGMTDGIGQTDNEGENVTLYSLGKQVSEETLLNKEPEIKIFTDEAREALEKAGYVVLELTGKTIQDYIDDGKPLFLNPPKYWDTGTVTTPSIFLNYYPGLTTIPSRKSQVAIKIEDFFLSGSDNQPLEKQEKMVDEFSESLKKYIPGVKAIMLTLPDCAALLWTYPKTYPKDAKLFYSLFENGARIRTTTWWSI